jgi:hypothetical protein
MKLAFFFISWVLVVLMPPLAAADVLTIPNLGNNSASHPQDVVGPSRGMTMEEVSAQFGNPQEIKQPVGDPPITRWVYDRFTVHFENNYVIHTVVHSQ